MLKKQSIRSNQTIFINKNDNLVCTTFCFCFDGKNDGLILISGNSILYLCFITLLIGGV